MLKNSSRLFVSWQGEAAAPQPLYAPVHTWLWVPSFSCPFPTYSKGLSLSLLVLPCTHHTSLCLPFLPGEFSLSFQQPFSKSALPRRLPSLLTCWASLYIGFVGLLSTSPTASPPGLALKRLKMVKTTCFSPGPDSPSLTNTLLSGLIGFSQLLFSEPSKASFPPSWAPFGLLQQWLF